MLTPKQAFDAIKLLYPETTHIDGVTNRNGGTVRWKNGTAYFCGIDAEVDWGGTPLYPIHIDRVKVNLPSLMDLFGLFKDSPVDIGGGWEASDEEAESK